jgi:hypothetical protein
MDLHQEQEEFNDDYSENESEPRVKKHEAIRVLTILFVLGLYFFIFLKILFIS